MIREKKVYLEKSIEDSICKCKSRNIASNSNCEITRIFNEKLIILKRHLQISQVEKHT